MAGVIDLDRLAYEVSRRPDFMDRLKRESRGRLGTGYVHAGRTAGTRTLPTAGATVNFVSPQVSPGRALLVTGCSLSADRACAMGFNFNNSGRTGAYSESAAGRVEFGHEKGETHPFAWERGLLISEYGSLSMFYEAPYGATENPFPQGAIQGWDLTNDFFWDAKYNIACFGDSNAWTVSGTNGTAGHIGNDMWPFLLTNRYRNLGKSVHLINYAYGGASSRSTGIRVESEMLGAVPIHLALLWHGMNDCTDSEANVKYGTRTLINRLLWNNTAFNTRQSYPPSIAVFGPPSTTDPARTGGIGNVRLWLEQVVAEYAALGYGAYVKYFSGVTYGTSAGDLTTYFGDNPGIHMNIAGHTKTFTDAIAPAVSQMPFHTRQMRLGAGEWS